jgi:ribosomal protein S12 methylthiotransferase accessory factor
VTCRVGMRGSVDRVLATNLPAELHSLLGDLCALCARAGVSRILEIGSLDRLALPIVSVVRPNAASVSVASGKGLSIAAALLSGVLESIELHYAENFDQALPLRDVPPGVRVPDPALLPRARRDSPRLDPSTPMAIARDVGGNQFAIPVELVHARLAPVWPSEVAAFSFPPTGGSG